MLFAATAICVLAVLAGSIVFGRSAARASRRIRQARALASTGSALVEQARGVSDSAARVRSDADRVRSLARLLE